MTFSTNVQNCNKKKQHNFSFRIKFFQSEIHESFYTHTHTPFFSTVSVMKKMMIIMEKKRWEWNFVFFFFLVFQKDATYITDRQTNRQIITE